MTNEQTPKEFWICDPYGLEPIVFDDPTGWAPGWDLEKAIHVIEYSAYQKLQKENEIFRGIIEEKHFIMNRLQDILEFNYKLIVDFDNLHDEYKKLRGNE